MMVMPFFIFNVSASDVVIEDFDSYAEGVTFGTNEHIEWESTSGTETSTTKKHSGSMSLQIIPHDTIDHTVWLNLSENIDVSGFEFYCLSTNDDCGSINYISVYSDTGVAFIKFKIRHLHLAGYHVQCWDYDGWDDISLTPTNNVWFGIGFQGNHTEGNPTNYVYYYVTNASGGLNDSVEKRWHSLDSYGSSQTLSYIPILGEGAGATDSYGYHDDFTILQIGI